jgi:hypothetical protein
MTNLELVKNEQIMDAKGKRIRRTPMAVSSSYSALVEYCDSEFNKKIEEVGCGKQTYFTIQDSYIKIIRTKI